MTDLFGNWNGYAKTPTVYAVNIAHYVGVALYVVACLQIAITLLYPVKTSTSAFAVYSRNISSIIMFIVLGYYLTFWAIYKLTKYHSKRTMRKYWIMNVIVIIGCIVKTLLAVYYTTMQMTLKGFSWLYYLGEAVAWACLSIFFIIYLKSQHVRNDYDVEKNHHHHKTKSEEKMDKVCRNQY